MGIGKVIAIGIGGFCVISTASCVGLVGWVATMDSGYQLSVNDLVFGGTFDKKERTAFETSCQAVTTERHSPEMCACVADFAAANLSRFDRLMVQATFEERPMQAAALIKDFAMMAESDPERVEQYDSVADDRMKAFKTETKRCQQQFASN